MTEEIKEQKKVVKKAETKDLHQWSVDFLLKEFMQESDRASVILACSLLDQALNTMLSSYLIPSPIKDDDFLNGNAPLSSFSSKIDACFRLGLISSRLCRDLHLIRKIRNKFAHDIQGCSFKESDTKSRIVELEKSMSGLVESRKDITGVNFSDAKESFLHMAGAVLYALNHTITKIETIKDKSLEFMYKIN